MIFEKQIVNAYKHMLFTRCDDTETVLYFSAKDFPGLIQTPYPFTASAGHRLQGYLYQYEGAREGRLIVFDHGFGGGHRAYMKEIERLCRHGYRVFAYDHTGCMESGGDSPRGLGQSLCDLNDCITVLKADEHLGGCELSVMGHSWGAFSTMNICALHPEITRVVALSGFVSVEEMIGTLFSGLLKGYRAPILAVEREANARFCAFHAVSSLAKSKTRALLIYSDNDTMCRPIHYQRLREGLDGCEGVELLLVRHKGHNPNYTEAAVRYLGEFGRKRAKLLRRRSVSAQEKAAFVASFDWHRMTEQDEAVWERILAHLDS